MPSEPADPVRVGRHRLNRDQESRAWTHYVAAALTDGYVAGLLTGAIIIAARSSRWARSPPARQTDNAGING